MIDNFNSENPKDKKAKKMVKIAFEFAIDHDLNINYDSSTNGLNFYFPKKGLISSHFTYLSWGDRDTRFNQMMNEAKELTIKIKNK